MGRRRRPPAKTAPGIKTPLPEIPPPPEHSVHDRIAITFFFVVFLTTLGAVLYLFADYATDAILAFLFAGLMTPIHARFLKLARGRAWIAALLSTAVIVVCVAGPTAFLAISLSNEATALYRTIKESLTKDRVEAFFFGSGSVATYAKRGAEILGLEYTPESVLSQLSKAAGAVGGFLVHHANTVVSNVASFLFHFVVLLLVFFYLLIDGERLKGWLYQMSPLPDDEDELIVSRFNAVGRAIFFGNGLGSGLQGLLGGLAMYAAGLPSPILWGTIMAIFAFLPMVGIGVVSLPAAIYLYIDGRPLAAILFFAFCTAQGLFIENVVKTRLIGSQMQLHDLLIFLSILGGLGMFGVLGLLYGPLLIALFFVLCDLYDARYKQDVALLRASRQ